MIQSNILHDWYSIIKIYKFFHVRILYHWLTFRKNSKNGGLEVNSFLQRLEHTESMNYHWSRKEDGG